MTSEEYKAALVEIAERREELKVRLIGSTQRLGEQSCPACRFLTFEPFVIYAGQPGNLAQVVEGICTRTECGFNWFILRKRMERDALSLDPRLIETRPVWKDCQPCPCTAGKKNPHNIGISGYYRHETCTGGFCYACLQPVGVPPVILAQYDLRHSMYRDELKDLRRDRIELIQRYVSEE